MNRHFSILELHISGLWFDFPKSSEFIDSSSLEDGLSGVLKFLISKIIGTKLYVILLIGDYTCC